MNNKINFSSVNISSDRIYHINENDIRIVISRLPVESYSRLRRVHFNDQSKGGRILGYVTFARKEISICALPTRMSMTRFLKKGQSPRQFGARRGSQWPQIAIRRFLLYYVFLRELGHLQIIDQDAKEQRRKFAAETKAHEFAEYWRRTLWLKYFEHPDPVHNHPSRKELEILDN